MQVFFTGWGLVEFLFKEERKSVTFLRVNLGVVGLN
jgi:hypothetical protein